MFSVKNLIETEKEDKDKDVLTDKDLAAMQATSCGIVASSIGNGDLGNGQTVNS